MTSRQATIECRITTERKQQWKTYLEDTYEVDTLSDLVRLAVEKERNDAHDQSPDPTDPSAIDRLDNRLDHVSTQLTQIQTQLETLQSEAVSSEDAAVDQVVSTVRSSLIEVPDTETFRELGTIEGTDPAVEARIEGTPARFAEILDVELSQVRRALTKADEQYPDVQYIHGDDGQRRYYRCNPQADHLTGDDETIADSPLPKSDSDPSRRGFDQ